MREVYKFFAFISVWLAIDVLDIAVLGRFTQVTKGYLPQPYVPDTSKDQADRPIPFSVSNLAGLAEWLNMRTRAAKSPLQF